MSKVNKSWPDEQDEGMGETLKVIALIFGGVALGFLVVVGVCAAAASHILKAP